MTSEIISEHREKRLTRYATHIMEGVFCRTHWTPDLRDDLIKYLDHLIHAEQRLGPRGLRQPLRKKPLRKKTLNLQPTQPTNQPNGEPNGEMT